MVAVITVAVAAKAVFFAGIGHQVHVLCAFILHFVHQLDRMAEDDIIVCHAVDHQKLFGQAIQIGKD